jgi:hypothetical protein
VIQQILYRLFDFLDIAKPPGQVDCIFVLAGRQERKTFGVFLWHLGYAPELILSVGRFEWRKYPSLNLPGNESLVKLVNATPPLHRHFFVIVNQEKATSLLIRAGRFGTRSEAVELAKIFHGRRLRTLMIVSTGIHLRRASIAFERAFRRQGVNLQFVAVPAEQSSLERDRWWLNRESRTLVFKELLKCALYRVLL